VTWYSTGLRGIIACPIFFVIQFIQFFSRLMCVCVCVCVCVLYVRVCVCSCVCVCICCWLRNTLWSVKDYKRLRKITKDEGPPPIHIILQLITTFSGTPSPLMQHTLQHTLQHTCNTRCTTHAYSTLFYNSSPLPVDPPSPFVPFYPTLFLYS